MELLRLIGDWLAFLWPFHTVMQYERGGFYRFGRYVREIGPGCYWRWPYFEEIKATVTVPWMVVTPRLDLTLLDGSSISIVASAWCQVTDFNLAVNTVENHEQTTTELLQAVLADKIATREPERLEPDNRIRLLSDLTRWASAESAPFGVTITNVRFSSFVRPARTYRLLM